MCTSGEIVEDISIDFPKLDIFEKIFQEITLKIIIADQFLTVNEISPQLSNFYSISELPCYSLVSQFRFIDSMSSRIETEIIIDQICEI